MGVVKETVKGSGPPAAKTKKKKGDVKSQNLIQMTEDLMDEISQCVQVKDDDTETEGDLQKAENIRKAQSLRSAHKMLMGVKAILEDY